MRVIRTRSRADALFMAEHLILWVHGGFGGERGMFGDIVRSTENDLLLLDALTDAVETGRVEQRKLLRSPLRHVATRLRPDMTLVELFDAWKKTPAPGLQGVHETFTMVTDCVGDLPVSRITGDYLCNFRDAVASLLTCSPEIPPV